MSPSKKHSAKEYLKWIPDTVRNVLKYEKGTPGRVNILVVVAAIGAGTVQGGLFSIYGLGIIIVAVYSSMVSQQSSRVKEAKSSAKN